MQISTIISYCSLDKRFIEINVRQCLQFSDDIIIVGFDSLLNGLKEDFEYLGSIKNIDSSKIRLLIMPVDKNLDPRYHHNLARYQGQKFARYQHVLFLDADEILEGDVTKEIFSHPDIPNIEAMSFDGYWYFRDPVNQATTTAVAGLLIDKTKFQKQSYFTNGERWGLSAAPGIRYVERIQGPNGPFLHHFSWVRTKEEMLVKVEAWGHKNDRDWAADIHKEFEHEFTGTDFVHKWSYRRVDNKFNIVI